LPHTSTITAESLAALCKRAFPERAIQQVEALTPLHSRQHEMVAFDLRWQSPRAEYIDQLIVRRYVSTLSWWRPDDRGKAQREATVSRWLHQRGLPVSVVYAREVTLQSDLVLFSRLPGQDWQHTGLPFSAFSLSQARPFAWLLAQLHKQIPNEPIKAVLPVVTLPTAVASLLALAIQIGQDEIGQIAQRIMPLTHRVVEAEPVLLHGDYHYSNILIDKGQISGIVDWEYSALGDPRWDVANAYMQMVYFDAAEAADAFLSAYLEYSGRSFEGPPLHSVVASLQQWAITEWLLHEQASGRVHEFGLAQDLVAQRDVHEQQARLALKLLEG
jgi:phosphotransferase family enzyme